MSEESIKKKGNNSKNTEIKSQDLDLRPKDPQSNNQDIIDTNQNKTVTQKEKKESTDSIEELFYIIENKKLQVKVSNKGGRIISAVLNGEKTYESEKLDLFISKSSKFNLIFEDLNGDQETKNLYFDADLNSQKNRLSMKLRRDKGYIEFLYTLSNDSYLIDFKINTIGLDGYMDSNQDMMLEWQMKTPITEKSKRMQDQSTSLQYQTVAGEHESLGDESSEATIDERI